MEKPAPEQAPDAAETSAEAEAPVVAPSAGPVEAPVETPSEPRMDHAQDAPAAPVPLTAEVPQHAPQEIAPREMPEPVFQAPPAPPAPVSPDDEKPAIDMRSALRAGLDG